MTPETLNLLFELYPVLARLPHAAVEPVLAHDAAYVHAPAGTVLFSEGAPCRGFPLVLRGAVRVARGSQGGRSLELYRVTPGEMCVISTTCLFGRSALSADGVAVEPTELVLLSATGFNRLAEEEAFRTYAFGTLADRVAQLMALVEAVAFQRLDRRLAAALLGHGPVVQATHQALADEVGTVREIVTRLLNRFEASGHLRIGRGRIEVLAPAALRRIAEGNDAETGVR
ncbi:MAG: Crp/Fnr family transcriptional regulator [Betaproteobacteria bacterium]|nr:Crp/Fnr family transcriptional regulator [Betaproteobacteria bacterium]